MMDHFIDDLYSIHTLLVTSELKGVVFHDIFHDTFLRNEITDGIYFRCDTCRLLLHVKMYNTFFKLEIFAVYKKTTVQSRLNENNASKWYFKKNIKPSSSSFRDTMYCDAFFDFAYLVDPENEFVNDEGKVTFQITVTKRLDGKPVEDDVEYVLK